MSTETTPPLTVAIIGTGRPRNTEGFTGFGMAHAHARAYAATGRCRFVAFCDIVGERAELFNGEHAGGEAAVFTDYTQMLAEARPDIVSICTWPHLHAPMVLACAEAGVRAVHCEKPMGTSWADARRMAAACRERNVQLTFNHQRRFLAPFQAARRLLTEGEIGELSRIEGACSDLYDWGTHWLDMFNFYNDETPGEWVIGQVDARRPRKVFGAPVDTQGLCQVRYANGVTGLLFTGEGSSQAAMGCANRLIGTEGEIAIHNEAPYVRLWKRGEAEPRPIDTGEGLHAGVAIDRGVADLIACLESGDRPLLHADNALRATEIFFACYRSAERRGRVDLPLDESIGHPLVDMLEAGVFPDAVEA